MQSYTNQRIWLDHLSLILELFIKSTDELKEQTKTLQEKESGEKGQLEKIPEEAYDDNDDGLAPLAMARSISMPLTSGQKSAG